MITAMLPAGLVGIQAAENPGATPPPGANLALVATPSTSYVSGHESLPALNNGYTPRNSNDKRRGAYGNWPRTGTQWVQYDWTQPISTRRMDVYWFDDRHGVRLPQACRLLYWNGAAFVPVPHATGLGLAENQFNTTTFPEITTSKLRIEMDGQGRQSTGILEWRVYDSGRSPDFPPTVVAGVDRVVIRGRPTYLNGRAKTLKPGTATRLAWSKASGPGPVTFAHSDQANTTATFSQAGEYELKLTATVGALSAADTLHVSVEAPPRKPALERIPTGPFQVTSPFWRPRLKAIIVNWIPHCIDRISDPELKQGGINNFVEAAKKLAGKPHGRHRGYVFANAWVYNIIESICLANQVEAQGDAEILRAQKAMRATLADWIPKILAAQEPDGYLQTFFTLNDRGKAEHWSPRHRGDHEGYVAGYFLEAAMAHHRLTRGQDERLYRAAKKLADCWEANLGPPPKKAWFDGHQSMEMALVDFGRYVNEVEGAGQGRKYIALAKFLLDCRRDGSEYDQSHVPVIQQYEAVGHAVRAAYSYAAMADVVLETGDLDYLGAVQSLWDNIVNRKYYVTGGIGSGETSEGFGPDYSLRNNAYCESCSSCGELFFQHNLNLYHRQAQYADLCEDTLYNAILGSLDLAGKNFYYQNPLEGSRARYDWHGCPCCVGNIPRTLLSLPTWAYAKSADGLFINLFLGLSTTVNNVAGTDVRLVQTTDYPWNGKVALAVQPKQPARFTVHVRAPNRNVSRLYTSTPNSDGITAIKVNGSPVPARAKEGYVSITREWRAGDIIEWELPLHVQRIKADEKIEADRGKVALRYGPLIYNFESVDQKLDAILSPDAPLTTEWQPSLLDGVRVIKGKFANGAPLLAIPNYARLNRGGESVVWIRDR